MFEEGIGVEGVFSATGTELGWIRIERLVRRGGFEPHGVTR
jgi:hypothetical protein